MKPKVVTVPSLKTPIQSSPGFAKKGLSDFKLDACGLCQFGCRYCSSNMGNYLRINRTPFANLTEQQLGNRKLPQDDPFLMFVWPDFLDRLEKQLATKKPEWGLGKTIVYSMLTDGFSPLLVKEGVTKTTLELVLKFTAFRIRILTKNAIVGTSPWINFFLGNPGRFVVGLSIGTLDGDWAIQVEIGTSSPAARLRAMQNLQQAGVPTFGMLCPIFPDVLHGDQLEQLVESIAPGQVEHLWAEPYNDRDNWKVVRAGYNPGTPEHVWFSQVYEHRRKETWSRYASELYLRLRKKARKEGWIDKLRYLLYEKDITLEDAQQWGSLEGIWLQSKPDIEGKSKNPHVAIYQ